MPRPRYHAAVSLGLAGLVVLRTREWRAAVPVLVSGVLVDLDHLVDLAVVRSTGKIDVLILPLHAWEWVMALVVRGTRLSAALAGGLAAHLALDQLNPVIRHPLCYSILVRASHGFRARPPLVDPERFERGAAWMTRSPLSWF